MALFIIPPQGDNPHSDFGMGYHRNNIRVYDSLQDAISDARNGDKILEVTASRTIGRMSFKQEKILLPEVTQETLTAPQVAEMTTG